MLDQWVRQTEREKSELYNFQIADVEEISPLTPELKTYLSSCLRDDRFPPGLLSELAEELGWKNVMEKFVLPKLPRNTNLKRGEFGEILTARILTTFCNYIVPVAKLRHKLTRGQSLPATDILALKVDDQGNILEINLVESKLRTNKDKSAAVKGQAQLATDYDQDFPSILNYVITCLYERNDPLFNALLQYLREREDNKDKDSFRLSLCWDAPNWDEDILQELQDSGIALSPLFVHVIRIKNLRQLTNELFEELGVTEVLEDD